MKPFALFAAFACLSLIPGVVHAHGDLDMQIENVSKEIRKSPTASLYLKRGELEREHREFKKALADYSKAAQLDPEMAAVSFCRGRALLEAGRYEEALPPLDRFLEKMPAHGEGFLIRARVYGALEKYERAADDYRRSIEVTKSPLPEHFLERAQVLVKAGDRKDALAALEAGMKRLGEIATLQLAAIEIDLAGKSYDSAIARVDKLMEAAQRKESWQIRRAEILSMAGRGEEAQQAYKQALSSIEALPERLRALKATQELEKKAHAGIKDPA